MANRINTELTLDTSQFTRSIAIATSKLDKFAKSAQAMGSTLTQNLTLPLGAVGVASVSAYADIQKLNKGLVAIMGSSEAAASEFQQLREVAKLPGLGLKEAVQGSINLQAVGLSADEARNTLFGFGKALAATGKGKVELEAIQYQLTQMISKNKLLAEDYKVIQSNLPLMAAGLREAFGTENIDRIRETGISAKDFTLQLSAALQRLPQTQNVTGGLANAFENLSDNAFIAASEFGQSIATAFNLEAAFTALGNKLLQIANWFKSLSPVSQKTIIIFTGIVAAIGPIIFIIGKLAGAWSIMLVSFGKAVKVFQAVKTAMLGMNAATLLIPAAIIGAIVAVGYLYTKFEGVRKVVNAVGAAFVELGKLAKDSFSKIVQGIQQLTQGEFKAAASSFGSALGNLNPVSLGQTFAKGFAEGFQDSTDYLSPTIDNIKKEVEKASNAFTFSGGGGTAATGGGGGGGGTAGLSEDQLKAQANLSSRLYEFASKTKGLYGFVRAELADLTNLTPKINEQKDALLLYGQNMDLLAQKAALFGESPLNEQLSATKTALEAAFAQFGPTSEAVTYLKTEYEGLADQLQIVNEKTEKQNTLGQSMASIFQSIGQSFSDAITGAISFGEAMRRVITDVISLLIQELVITVVKNTANGPLGKLLGPAIVPVAIAAGTAAGGLAKSLLNTVKLAKGGLAFGETLAVVGDNPNAGTDPEVIAPLSKLKDYLSGSGDGGYIAEARISGNDLLILVNNAERRNGRIR